MNRETLFFVFLMITISLITIAISWEFIFLDACNTDKFYDTLYAYNSKSILLTNRQVCFLGSVYLFLLGFILTSFGVYDIYRSKRSLVKND